VIYTIASIPTVNGIRFYIQDQNGNRRQGGCATREKAEQVIARLEQYSLRGRKNAAAQGLLSRLSASAKLGRRFVAKLDSVPQDPLYGQALSKYSSE